VQVNKTWKHDKRDFECAAWREEWETVKGVYPITLEADRYGALSLIAKIGAVVIDDYFPSLWGGMPVSNKPYVPKHLGAARELRITIDIAEAIECTSNSPGNDKDLFIDKKHWGALISEAEASLKRLYSELPSWWDKYAASEDEYDSRVGMVAHVANEIVVVAKDIQKMNRQLKYQTEKSDMWRGYYVSNTAWARDAQATTESVSP